MSDIFHCSEPGRILVRTTTGGVQAWKTEMDVSISVSFDLQPRDGGCGHAGFSQFMTATDARSLADALVKAADHADALATPVEAARCDEAAMGDRPDPKHPMFRNHNCSWCGSGERRPCKVGDPYKCDWPHARND